MPHFVSCNVYVRIVATIRNGIQPVGRRRCSSQPLSELVPKRPSKHLRPPRPLSLTGLVAMVTGQIGRCNLSGAISIAEVAGDARRAMLARGIAQGTDLLDNPSIGPGVRQQLVRIIAELINNAAKYTAAGGHVWLSARREALTVPGDRACSSPEAIISESTMAVVWSASISSSE